MAPNGEVSEPYFALANVHGICRDDGLGQAEMLAGGAWTETQATPPLKDWTDPFLFKHHQAAAQR